MLIEQRLSDEVLDCCYRLHDEVGPGLSERIYQRGLFNKFKKRGILVSMEKKYKVFNEGELLGDYYADLVVDNRIIIECKTVRGFSYSMEEQLLNYLRISGLRVGYLVNFKIRFYIGGGLLFKFNSL